MDVIHKYLVLLAGVLTLASPAGAQALPSSGNLVSNNFLGQSITFFWGEALTYGESSTTLSTWAGTFASQFTASPTTTTVNYNQPLLLSYCAQIEVLLGTNQPVTTRSTATSASDWKSNPPNTNTTGQALAFLYNNFGNQSSTGTNAVFQGTTQADRQARAAGLQLALWEVAEDFTGSPSSIGFGTGIIQSLGSTNATVLGYANSYTDSLRTALAGSLSSETAWLDGVTTASSGQDLITSNSMIVIPEPSSLLLLLPGLLFLRRRSR